MPALPQSDEPLPSIARRANYTLSRANGAVLRIEWSWPGMAGHRRSPEIARSSPAMTRKKLAGIRHQTAVLLAQPFDREPHPVARLEELRRLHADRHPRRSAGRDHVARHQRREMTDVADDVVDAEDQVGGVAVLDALAVDLGPQLQFTGIADLVGGHHPGAEGTERVAALALRPLAAALHLVGPLGDIVHDAEPGDVVRRVVNRDIAGGGGRVDTELNLPVGLLGSFWDDHVVVGAADAGRRLHKKDRLGRDRHSRLLRMQPVIEADRDDLADIADARPDPRRAVDGRQARRVERLQ